MKTIASFTVNHDTLQKGMYVSRIDGDVVTYDIRMKVPNQGDYLSNGAMHTFEHLFATCARNGQWADQVLYVGPMGCRTGFYVIFAGDLKSEDILPVLREAADFVLSYEGEIPGYSPRDCGNYLDNNLNLAKIYMRKFKQEVLDNPAPERLVYPQ